METVNVIREVFEILHNQVYECAKFGHEAFYKNNGDLVRYGVGKNPDKSSIKCQILSSLAKFPESDKKPIFHRTFSARELYDLQNELVNEAPATFEIRHNYLDAYCIFIGYDDFDEFLKSDHVSDSLHRKQSQNGNEDNLRDSVVEGTLFVPNYFFGAYEGYFFRPKKKHPTLEQMSRITLLIDSDSQIFLQTTQTSSFEKMHYQGRPYITGNTMTFEFQRAGYSFFLVFDITTRKNEIDFDGYLKGIYGGSDPVLKKPTAGRMILIMKEKWADIILKETPIDVLQYFLNDQSYIPSELSDSHCYDLLHAEQINGVKNDLLAFFTTEVRYMENIGAIDNYLADRTAFKQISGWYSLYTLRSDGLTLNISPTFITLKGKVKMNGSKHEEDFRQYKGEAEFIGDNKLLIYTHATKDSSDVCFYLMRVDFSIDNRQIKFNNGVRIMTSENPDYKPFSGRVLLIKEPDSVDYTLDSPMISVPILPTNEEEKKIKSEFIADQDKAKIMSFLTGFENNVVKSFDERRIEGENVDRDIDYGLTFCEMAKYYSKVGTERNILLNLHYAQIHGHNKVSDIDITVWEKLNVDVVNPNHKKINFNKIDSVFYFFIIKEKIPLLTI